MTSVETAGPGKADAAPPLAFGAAWYPEQWPEAHEVAVLQRPAGGTR